MDLVLKKHFDKFMAQGKLPPELRNTECESTGCQLFSDSPTLEVWRNNRKGITFEDENGNILKGAVDNILVKDKKLIVLDYKTRGFPLKEDTHKHYIDQLNIYNFLLRKNGYSTESYSFLLFYYPREVLESGEVAFDIRLIKIPIDVNSAEELWKESLRVLNSPCPKESCEWCEFVKE
jgi:hypothetical protein